MSFLGPDLSAKRLEILKETFPGITRIAVLWNIGNPASASDFRETQSAAQAFGLQVRSLGVHNLTEIEDDFRTISSDRPEAIVILPENLTGTYARQIAELAVKNKIPSMGGQGEPATAGGPVSYEPNPIASYRRAAVFVDKILKGSKPADLPVEQPTKFDFIINLKTAKELGITIPQSVLAQATEVIQ